MRVLIRRGCADVYLQADGSWGKSRETARTFPGSSAAYWWAHEAKLLGIEVLLAFDDPQYDYVAMRV